MDPLDQNKHILVLNDAQRKLLMLGLLPQSEDANSELAGFELNKLLTEQRRLEVSYADLITTRGNMQSIAKRDQLLKNQEEIQQVAKKLKESTKKLCRLFKENPNFENDALKVVREREELKAWIEDIILGVLQNNSGSLQGKVLQELENQDLLRELLQRELNLTNEIKKLHTDKLAEQKEFQVEMIEKGQTIQEMKEKLMFKKGRADQKKFYQERDCRSSEDTCKREYDYKEKAIRAEIESIQSKAQREEKVFDELMVFLQEKDNEIREKSQTWASVYEDKKEEIQKEKERLEEDRLNCELQLKELKERYDFEKVRNRKKEEEEIQKEKEKIQFEIDQKRIDNAITLLKLEYEEALKKKKPPKPAVDPKKKK